MKAYHGSNARFDKFDVNLARVTNDFYGGPLYFTDELSVAKSYARTMSRKEGIPLVYEVKLNMKKTFDIDQKFTGDELVNFVKAKGHPEEFASGAGLLRLGNDRIKTLSDLKSGNLVLTGESVFRGLSRGMINSLDARKSLIKLGYDSLRYNGGRMGIPGATNHNVYIPYNASMITIMQRYIVKPPADRKSSNETYKFI